MNHLEVNACACLELEGEDVMSAVLVHIISHHLDAQVSKFKAQQLKQADTYVEINLTMLDIYITGSLSCSYVPNSTCNAFLL